jgi:hypothetical protein
MISDKEKDLSVSISNDNKLGSLMDRLYLIMNKIQLGVVLRLASLVRNNAFYFSKGTFPSTQTLSISSTEGIRTEIPNKITKLHRKVSHQIRIEEEKRRKRLNEMR